MVEFLARSLFACLQRVVVSALCRFVEYTRAGSLWVIPELTAAIFSGLVTVGGRGGINDCFGGVGSGGPIGSGGFGTTGGNGGCDMSVVRLGVSESIGFPSSIVAIVSSLLACFLLEPGHSCEVFDVCPGVMCLVSSCTI